jgi:hypothetical protein
MTAYNVLSPSAMAAGQPEDISVVLGNFQAIAAIINGGLDNGNLNAAAAIAISKLAGYPADVTKVLKGDGTWAAPASITIGLTLPLTPTDGQEAILTDSLTVPTYAWRMRYNASSTSAYKWEYMGGTPMRSIVDTSETNANSAFVDLPTVGPQLTTPRDGDYELHFGCWVNLTPGSGYRGEMAPKIGAAATSSLDAITFAGPSTAGNGCEASISRSIVKTALAATTLLKMQYRNDGATPGYARRWFNLTPRRIS